MALHDNPTQITEVLLGDGWHPVMNSSFLLSGQPDDTQTEFTFINYIATAGPTNVRITGAVPAILAVKRDPRRVGQVELRFVNPDGHLEVRIGSEWKAIPEVVGPVG